MENIKIYADGGSRGNPGKAAAAFVIMNNGKIVERKGFFLGVRTNNEAEYSAVIFALKWLVEAKVEYEKINFFLDSELVTKQLKGLYKIKSKNLIALMRKLKILEGNLKLEIKYHCIPREKNRLADFLVNEVLDGVEMQKKSK